VYVAIDDYSREAVARIVDERSTKAATASLDHVLARLPHRSRP
jgi:hypothetical protein